MDLKCDSQLMLFQKSYYSKNFKRLFLGLLNKNKLMQKSLLELPASLVKYDPPLPATSKQIEQILNSDEVPQGRASTRDLLNILLPPRQFTFQKEGKQIAYVQYTEADRLKRQDVDILKQKLQGFLSVRKARDQPICPIRENIFAEAFDEIIRQVLIDCPQRGIMLSRIKNQLYLTITAYRTLYEQSLSFSKYKLSQTENNLTELEQQEISLLDRQKKLKQQEAYLLSKRESLQQKLREIKTIYKEKREHEQSQLKLQQQGLIKFLMDMNKLPEMMENQLKESHLLMNRNDDDKID